MLNVEESRSELETLFSLQLDDDLDKGVQKLDRCDARNIPNPSVLFYLCYSVLFDGCLCLIATLPAC